MADVKLKNFIIDIKKGRPAFTSEAQRAMFNDFLKQFEGKKVWMTIDPKMPKRSDRQNRYYWLYLGIISQETGHEAQDLHFLFKNNFLFDPMKDLTTVLGTLIIKDKSTTDLTKTQFAEYIEKISRLTGITPPDATIFQLAPMKEYE